MSAPVIIGRVRALTHASKKVGMKSKCYGVATILICAPMQSSEWKDKAWVERVMGVEPT